MSESTPATKKKPRIKDDSMIIPLGDLPQTGQKDAIKAYAIALRAMGHSYRTIAKHIGSDKSTVHMWVNDIKENNPLNDVAGRIKKQLASKQYMLSNGILSSITDEDIQKASLMQKITSSSILIDKARLIEGEATESIHHHYSKKKESDDNIIDVTSSIDELEAQLNNE